MTSDQYAPGEIAAALGLPTHAAPHRGPCWIPPAVMTDMRLNPALFQSESTRPLPEDAKYLANLEEVAAICPSDGSSKNVRQNDRSSADLVSDANLNIENRCLLSESNGALVISLAQRTAVERAEFKAAMTADAGCFHR